MIFLIIGIVGAIGSGKSFTQLKQGLLYADQREKQLVFNFPVNVSELYRYASSPVVLDLPFGHVLYEFKKLFRILLFNLRLLLFSFGLGKLPRLRLADSPRMPWVAKLCKYGGISVIYNPEHLEALMIPDSVVLLDEAGILLNSREFANTSKKLLADLAQSRKDGVDLFWCAQFDDQVDRQFRMLTQFFIHCQSLSVFDRVSKRPKLKYKQIFWFSADVYQRWVADLRVRSDYLKTRFAYAIKAESGTLTASDRQLFKVYNSFTRLDESAGDVNYINTISQCRLPSDYYLKRLEDYRPESDPFSAEYQPLYGYWFKKSNQLVSVFPDSSFAAFSDKSSLIRRALSLSRAKGIKAPLFKSMAPSAIEKWIAVNSK
jgi:hypothetical protein